jgi:hypothetical protein
LHGAGGIRIARQESKDKPEARNQKPEEKAKLEVESQKPEEKSKTLRLPRFCGVLLWTFLLVSGFRFLASPFLLASGFWFLACFSSGPGVAPLSPAVD